MKVEPSSLARALHKQTVPASAGRVLSCCLSSSVSSAQLLKGAVGSRFWKQALSQTLGCADYLSGCTPFTARLPLDRTGTLRKNIMGSVQHGHDHSVCRAAAKRLCDTQRFSVL